MLNFNSLKISGNAPESLKVEEISEKDIAIIGMAGMFPGSGTLEEFWEILKKGVDCIGDFPAARHADADCFRKHLGMNAPFFKGAYLDAVDKFDYKFFHLSPNEAGLMSPNQRLFLEAAWNAIEDAGYGGYKLSGTVTGVYIGFEADAPYDYKRLIAEMNPGAMSLAVTGNLTPIIASRISYLLDLKGPSMSIDTACSSALVAVHTACRAIRNGECNLALAGSVKINLLPVAGQLNFGVNSSDGRARAFDDSSDGTGSGEGVAAVLLKPLNAALKDGDHIYAVIKGSAVNQDGKSLGISAPNVLAQEQVIVKAWEDAAVNPETISYIEAHGTGTQLGDPVEIDGIRKAFGRYTQSKQFCAIGTVKTNIGHLDNAAGIAGLIKSVLALKHRQIPPSLHFNKPNRRIDFENSPVYINNTLSEWKTEGFPRRCGISSFGFSGTNCHIILEEAPEQATTDKKTTFEYCVFVLSAYSPEVLIELVRLYAGFLPANPDLNLRDICYTASTGRGHYHCRLALIAEDRHDLENRFRVLASGGFSASLPDNVFYGEHKISSGKQDQAGNHGITENRFKNMNPDANALLMKNPGYRQEQKVLLDELCRLYINGAEIDWDQLYRSENRKRVNLPAYPFRRTRCWVVPQAEKAAPGSAENIGQLLGMDTIPAELKNEIELHLQKWIKQAKTLTGSPAPAQVPGKVKLVGRKTGEYTVMEHELAVIWKTVLGYDEININENFYVLGGDSIAVINVMDRIKQKMNVQLGFREFNENTTIAYLANLVSEKKAAAPGFVQAEDYPVIVPDPLTLHEPFPLTFIQLAYLLGRDANIEMGGISTHTYCEIETRLDLAGLNAGLNKVIRRHPMLRAVVLTDGRQKILENLPEYVILSEDLRHLNQEEQQAFILKERGRMSHYVFPSGTWPLFEFKAFRLTDDTHYLFIGFDILIADGYSLQLIFREWMDFYKHPELELPAIGLSFRDYMRFYTQLRSSGLYNASKAYWLGRLDTFPPAPALPLAKNPESVKNPYFRRKSFTLRKEDWDTLKKLGQGHGVTPSVLLCTAYADILAFWSNQPALTINLTLFNRYPVHEDINKVVGDFTSLILLGLNLETGASFWDRAKYVHGMLMEAIENRHYDAVELIREISRKYNTRSKAIMPVVFTSLLFGGENDLDAEWDQYNSIKMAITQTPQVFLDYQAIEKKGALVVQWDYVDELFTPATIDCMFDQYLDILRRLAAREEEGRVRLPETQLRAVEKYNATTQDIAPSTLCGMFTEQALRTPGNTAVVYGNDSITYGELDILSNRIAHALAGKGVGRGDLVGVMAFRRINTIANILGILKSGAAYVPIEPMYPEERRNYILDNSRCKLLLEPGMFTQENPEQYACGNVPVRSLPSDTAYVIYTSGSTGKPKGVSVTHQAAANTIIDINRKFKVNAGDRIIGLSSLCFDLSVYDVFGALSTGAALVQIADQRDVKNIAEVLEREKITIWNSVPALLDLTLDNPEIRDAGSVCTTAAAVESECREPVPGKDAERVCAQEEATYFWAPTVHWENSNGRIVIGDYTDSDTAPALFPHFYFLAQKGFPMSALSTEFPHIPQEKLKEFASMLIKKRVLVDSILTPAEVFSGQDRFYDNPYGDEIRIVAEEHYKFKQKQLGRVFKNTTGQDMFLDECIQPPVIAQRRTYRKFDEHTAIAFKCFSRLLSVFRQYRVNNEIKFYYASAGGLYPLDVFVYVKENRVENLQAGLYYYNPQNNSLLLVESAFKGAEDAYLFTNKAIFKSSAFSLYLIYNAGVNMPMYGGLGYFFSAIDSGVMVGTLTHAAEHLDMGICSIGDIAFEKIEKHFHLEKNQVLIHTIEAGLKPGRSRQADSYNNLEMKPASPTAAPVVRRAGSKTAGQGTAAGLHGPNRFDSLRLVMLSGDWIPLNLPGKINKAFLNAETISLGGATEAAIWSIYYPVRGIEAHWKSIPYGWPLANQSFHVLNYELKPCPTGVEGELYIGGAGLAQGYLNDTEKTRQAFINHPGLGRLYKTGDYGVLHEEGYLEFRGRKDYQVKIRGYRIELEEIEKCLTLHPAVKNAVVADFSTPGGSKYLCAYVITGVDVSRAEIREHLAKLLPDYMVPQYIRFTESIPLTPNGKVDRKALVKPVITAPEANTYAAPANAIEEKLVVMWQEVLGLERVGVNDNFFEIGGDSVLLVRMHTNLETLYPGKVKITDVFAYETITKLVALISKKSSREEVRFNPLPLPEEFFSAEPGNSPMECSFKVDALDREKLRKLLSRENAEMHDVFLLAFVFLLAEISGKTEIEVQVMTEQAGMVRSLKMNIAAIDDFADFFKVLKAARAVELNMYRLTEQDELNINRDKHSIVPFYYKKALLPNNAELMKLYDFTLEQQEEESVAAFVCEYSGRLKSEKVETMVRGFSKLLRFAVEQSG